MSGHTSRSRSPSSANGGQHSPSFVHSQNTAMDPSLFNTSVYQAGANLNQNQFLNAGQIGQGYGLQEITGQQYGNDFGFESKNGMMNGGLMLDPALENSSGSVNPTDLMGSMSPQDQVSPTSGFGSGLGSQHHSPALTQGGFASASPAHSRHHSLDPSSAGIGQGFISEWTGHRRSPSDQSDVSSVVHSPYQAGADFPDNLEVNHSPLLNPSADPSLLQDGIDMRGFTISDAQRRASISQQNSPYISPSLVPAPVNGGLPEGQFVLPSNVQQDQFSPGDIGQASQLETPQINVEFAPAGMNQSQAMGQSQDNEALSPPHRGRPGGRNRAQSDTSLGPGPMSRPLSPQDLTPTFASQPGMLNADINQPQRHRSLSPFDATFPANYRGSSTGRSSSSRRSSTSSINPNRDYILELADPNRPSAGSGSGTRVQKHPATFQCTMCPKRFTRAYNLRSHLRTHTDERPFVCSVCGKAFARQHDRKRHEGLHSGEKKFVCKGDLSNGQGQWGCGRRFARADALGRHFRSEAGRVCIKPLLDEEQAEKRRAYEQSVLSGAGMGPHGMMPPGSIPPPPAGVLPSQGTGVDLSMPGPAGAIPVTGPGFALPQAILMQYPALQGLQWDQLGNGQVGADDDGALSGRSSFDASGEVYEDEDGYLSGPGTNYGQGGWASDQGGI